MNNLPDFISVSHSRSERWSIEKSSKTRAEMKGGVKFFNLKKLSTNLYATFQKCTLYACKIRYYYTFKSKGGVRFTPPYTTFTPPFINNKEHVSALKHSRKGFCTPPFNQKANHPALEAGSQDIGFMKGGVNHTYLVLKGGVKGGVQKYATFQGLEVIA